MMLFVHLRLRSPSSLSHICNFLLAMGNIADNPWWLSGKESTCPYRRHGFDPWVMKIPWRRQWQPTPVFLPGEFHRQRSLAGHSPWGCKELNETKQQQQWVITTCFFSYLSIKKINKYLKNI